MPSSSFTSSSLLLLQSIAPFVLGSAIPGSVPPEPPPEPEPPFRACAPFCDNPTYKIAEPDIYPGKDIWIVTIGRPGLFQSEAKPDISKVLATYENEALPYFLNQVVADNKTVPALATIGIPLLVDTVTSIAKRTDVAPNVDKLKAWTQQIAPKEPCDFFATAAVAILSVVGDTVYFANPPEGTPTTRDQDYFLQPAYGPLSHRDDIVIHYNSKFPAFWDQTPTTNIDRNVYLRTSQSCSKNSSPDFEAQMRLLLLQFVQLKQWSEVDYVDTVFQIRYLNEYCKAGFKFAENKYEIAAAADGHSVDKLLDPIGELFFKVWSKFDLYATLGYPNAKSYSPAAASCSQNQIYTLKFDKGDLQIKKCGTCSRTLCTGKTSAWVGQGC